MMAPGSIEMSLQQEEQQPGKGETAWVLETGWHSERLVVGVESRGPPEEGEGWTFITVTGLQVAVLGQGCKGALFSWNGLCSLLPGGGVAGSEEGVSGGSPFQTQALV